MTTKEMIYQCDIKIRNILKSDNISVDTDDWLKFLNEGQELVFRKYIPLEATTLTQFDLSPDTRSNLAALIKDKQYTPTESRSYISSKMSGANFIFDYPSDLKYIDYAEVAMTKNGNTYIARVKDVEPRYYFQNIKNPFKKPYSELVWRRDYGSNGKRNIEIVIPAGFSLVNFTLRYLIELPCLSMESDSLVASSLHWDIVNNAVDICLKSHQNNLYLHNIKQE